jgi:hypothetical protein
MAQLFNKKPDRGTLWRMYDALPAELRQRRNATVGGRSSGGATGETSAQA